MFVPESLLEIICPELCLENVCPRSVHGQHLLRKNAWKAFVPQRMNFVISMFKVWGTNPAAQHIPNRGDRRLVVVWHGTSFTQRPIVFLCLTLVACDSLLTHE